MHPAPSMIVFTVLSGLGLGMIAWIGIGIGAGSHLFGWVSAPIALAVTGLGGLASVGHLGRPDRAWRAFSQWRSSWLSREACLMVLCMGVFLVYIALWLLTDTRIAILGWLAAALALATVYATSMIYHQLSTVPRWSATPTPALFLVFSLTGGLIGVGGCMGLSGLEAPTFRVLIAVLIAGGTAIWWQTQAAGARRGSQGSSMETATGLGRLGRVRLLEPPHTGSNYLLKEMAYRIGRDKAFQLRKLGAIAGFLLPLALVVLSWALGDWALLIALLFHVAGMLALRWLFFAEAQHVQALYYGIR